MTLDDLRPHAKQILRDMRDEMRRTGNMRPLFRCYYADGGKQDFRLPPGTEALMNSGGAKEMLFDFLRKHTDAGGIEAWIFATDTFGGRATEEGAKHVAEFPQHTDTGFAKLAAMGWVVVEQLITLTMQTPTEVAMLQQCYVRNGPNDLEWIGPPIEKRFPQEQFGGRQKMWGATPDDITGADPRRKGAERIGLDAL